MKRLLIIAAATMLLTSAKAQVKYPWQDTRLSRAERVENLLSMLTPEEKVGLMMNKSISRYHLTTGGVKHVTVCVKAATPSIRNLSEWRQHSARNWYTRYSRR